MSPLPLNGQLQSVGRMVSRWRAQLKLVVGVAAVVTFVWTFSLMDLWLQYGRVGRFVIWVLLVALLVVTVQWVGRTLAVSFTPQAVAVMVERAFPQLDNHLINYLQFAADTRGDAFREAYVRQGVPQWQGLNLQEMKNRRAHRRALLSLLVAVGLIVSPGLFMGRAWGIAVWRVVNPFTDTKPAALTHIVAVEPGTETVLQGAPAVLVVKVEGKKGHAVSLDLEPSDQEASTYALGKIEDEGIQTFSYRIPKVNTAVKYRFRAGDAPFPAWYTLTTRPPLGFEALAARVTPPAYTKQPAHDYDGLAEEMTVPAGARVALRLRSNLPIDSLKLQRGGSELTMARMGDPTSWSGEVNVSDANPLRVTAVGANGDHAEQTVRFSFVPDRVPGIKVLSPEGRPVLTPGAVPEISFAVNDDYGLDEVWVELVGAREEDAKILQTWRPGGNKEFLQTWRDESPHGRDGRTLAYRVVARDNSPDNDAKRLARSPVIVFNAQSAEDVSQERSRLETEAFSTLAKLIELQRANLTRTDENRKVTEAGGTADWQGAAQAQEEIRVLMKGLLENPISPLGNLTATAQKLYLNEMAEVIPLLSGVPTAEASQQPTRIARAVNMEQKILRQLTFADDSAAKTMVQQRSSAVSGMLARMIQEQAGVKKDTQTCVDQSASVASGLVDRQDNLAMDVTEFAKSCRTEAEAVKANDESMSALLVKIAESCEAQNIRDDMMLASEQLDGNKPFAALPHETTALGKLEALQAMLSEVQAAEAVEEQELLVDSVAQAKERLKKIEDVHRKALESMEMVMAQKDKSTKDLDLLEEEYKELVANTKEALLQVPTDLHIFMELNVANDIVEDVLTVFEEVEQAAGSENLSTNDVKEQAIAKREEYLEQMEEAEARLDELEHWLANKPEAKKITTESFDKQEMPEAGMALGALKSQAEDLIGDLLENKEDMAKEAEDGSTNHGLPDNQVGNDVLEGDTTSFSAEGKSGNERPEHRDQDGRSNVGRQGMSSGETAAGSGTINEGDDDIEARRTQDPTQSGQTDINGENIKTVATGGGKLGTGKADGFGMEGGVKRMDSTEAGSLEGMNALMAKRVDAMYAQASLQNVRCDSLKDAAHHLRQAEDAVAKGQIAQVKELRKMALASLQRAKTQMDAASTGSFTLDRNKSLVSDVVEGGPELAPPKYREMVSEYYKLLNSNL